MAIKKKTMAALSIWAACSWASAHEGGQLDKPERLKPDGAWGKERDAMSERHVFSWTRFGWGVSPSRRGAGFGGF